MGTALPAVHMRGRCPHGPPRPQVQQLERSIGLKDLAMADLEQKVHDMEAATFDGVFIWKISDFARKRQEAVAGRTPAIFSPGAALLGPHPLSLGHVPCSCLSSCTERAGGPQPWLLAPVARRRC